MSDTTREYVDKFWEMLDEVFNSVLFVLIGLEVLAINFQLNFFWAGLVAIFVVLLSRLISVGIPISLMRLRRDFIPNTIFILTWGGLRGGISVALALSLTGAMPRDLIVSVTYIVVVFSIVFQGLSIGALVKRMNLNSPEEIS
jgi:CPA1 family monovalent cation:H+ antiporter